ncbi:hypothetical protein SeLEV6574_g05263 [Synchytrium endobioticum]|uniref:Histone acetyltransferase n=1 Tax=Synchytrium endobioticum TaxID=286115 RepID=A0A507CV58_9FUNG|nr:hypothetical protein SeLEV6574_g05263 [Synchytrium endobioticum]
MQVDHEPSNHQDEDAAHGKRPRHRPTVALAPTRASSRRPHRRVESDDDATPTTAITTESSSRPPTPLDTNYSAIGDANRPSRRRARRDSQSQSPTRSSRPRKRFRKSSASVQPEDSRSVASIDAGEEEPKSDRPLEERSFNELWPDLDPQRPLPVLRFPKLDVEMIPVSVDHTTSRNDSENLQPTETNTNRRTKKKPLIRTPSPDKITNSDVRVEDTPHDGTGGPLAGYFHFRRDHYLRVEEPTAIPPLNIDISKPVPKPSFRHVQIPTPLDNEAYVRTGPKGVSYRGSYIRYIEPSEDELAERVEYDMDEQDKAWLLAYNQERRGDGVPDISEAFFELIMDRFEKEWFDLTKDLQKEIKAEMEYPEDIVCAVCDDGEAENSNAIVFCDGCNLAVHQDCYGIPFIPEGQYLCRKCMISPETPVSCVFCPNEGGAFKQTATNRWAHVLCALFIPEVGFRNPTYMEPVDNIDKVPKSRWKLTCYLCKRKKGACIQCAQKNCYLAYHVTCAQKCKLYMKMKSHNPTFDDNLTKTFCDKHTPREHREGFDVEARIAELQQVLTPVDGDDENAMVLDQEEEDADTLSRKRRRSRKSKLRRIMDDDDDEPEPETNISRTAVPSHAAKSAQAHSADFTPSAHVLPIYIINVVINEVAKMNIRKKNHFVEDAARYWSLKRESRRGAPLLKRLHLEPWTANASAMKEDEKLKAQRYEVLTYIRRGLERARTLAELVRKREREKLRRMQVQREYIDHLLFPLNKPFRSLLDDLKKYDSYQFFHVAVRAEDVPDYYDVIKNPMDFSSMEKKLDNNEYRIVDDFEVDVNLICTNCMLYNKPDTVYWRTAQRMQKKAQPMFGQLRAKIETWNLHRETGILNVELSPFIFSYGPPSDYVDPAEIAEREARVDERIRRETEDVVHAVAEAEAAAVAAEAARQKAEQKAQRDAAKQEERLADVVAALTSPKALRNRVIEDAMGNPVAEKIPGSSPPPPPSSQRRESTQSPERPAVTSLAVCNDVAIVRSRSSETCIPDNYKECRNDKSYHKPTRGDSSKEKSIAERPPLPPAAVILDSPVDSNRQPPAKQPRTRTSTSNEDSVVNIMPPPITSRNNSNAKISTIPTAPPSKSSSPPLVANKIKLLPPTKLIEARKGKVYEEAVKRVLSGNLAAPAAVAGGRSASSRRVFQLKPFGEAVPLHAMDHFVPFDDKTNDWLWEVIHTLRG